MSLILIHTDYQKGSPQCPVCNTNRGEIRRNSFKLCSQCDMAAFKPDPVSALQPIARTNVLARAMLLLMYGITIVLMEIGYAIRTVSRAVRVPGSDQRRHAPFSNAENNAGQPQHSAFLRECKI